ncbi:hypothetical protein D3C81_2311460 [compost metagenome]
MGSGLACKSNRDTSCPFSVIRPAIALASILLEPVLRLLPANTRIFMASLLLP